MAATERPAPADSIPTSAGTKQRLGRHSFIHGFHSGFGILPRDVELVGGGNDAIQDCQSFLE